MQKKIGLFALLMGIVFSSFRCGAVSSKILSGSGSSGGSGDSGDTSFTGPFLGALSLGASSYITSSGSANYGMGASFTIELWVKGAAASMANQTLVSLANLANATFASIDTTAAGYLRANFSLATCGTTTALPGATTVLAPGTKYHLAFIGHTATTKLFINGSLEMDSGAMPTSCPVAIVTVGATNTGTNSFNGLIDEVRISNIARYTAAFTPPTTPFTNDANTVYLQHFDSSASTVDNTLVTGMSSSTSTGTVSLVASPFP